MSWEYYIVPTLFWVAAAVIGVGFIVGIAMVISAVRDLINLECKDSHDSAKQNQNGENND